MSLKFNGASPKSIIYNNTDITSVEYNGEKIWGKAFVLTKTVGLDAYVTVARISSPNQHASTGTLGNGATIYFGDELEITATTTTGFTLGTFTVNGANWTSGNTIVVTSSITVIAQTTAAWHTIMSSSKTVSINSLTSGTRTIGISGITATDQIRVTGTITFSKVTFLGSVSRTFSTPLSALETTCGAVVASATATSASYFSKQSSGYRPSIGVSIYPSNGVLSIYYAGKNSSGTTIDTRVDNVIITKVEKYI